MSRGVLLLSTLGANTQVSPRRRSVGGRMLMAVQSEPGARCNPRFAWVDPRASPSPPLAALGGLSPAFGLRVHFVHLPCSNVCSRIP